MSGATDLIESVLDRHRFLSNPPQCLCAEWWDSGPGPERVRHNYNEHVAAEIDAALGTLEPWTATEDGGPTRSAWVSGWTVTE